VYSVSHVLLLILLPIFPRLVGVFIFINASETNVMMHVTREYFIDEKKYCYFILLHLDAAFFVGAISLTAIGTLFAGYFKHICAIFKIAR